jgi:MoaA/NifB/PqqE/SkfB family radical SAM enzyme
MFFKKVFKYYHNYGVKLLAQKALQRIWLNITTPKKFRSLPKHLHIETTNTCNLNCEYCVLKEMIPVKQVMDLNKFKTLGPYFKHVYSISLSGLAEPLINKDIDKFIAYIKGINKKCWVSIFSNATLLTREICHKLIDSGLDQFIFSIDSTDPELNDSIRIGSDLNKIIANLKILNEVRKERKTQYPHLFATTVLQKKNYKELPKIIGEMAAFGIKELGVNYLEPYKKELLDTLLWYPESDVPKDLEAVLNESKNIAIKKNIVLKLVEPNPVSPECNINVPFILPNGDVTACSVLAYERDYFFKVNSENKIIQTTGKAKKVIWGNVFSESLETIWKKEEYVRFRKLVMENKFPSECEHCLVKHRFVCA